MNDLTSEVRSVFADVTRYPFDILEPQASLEEDLGIDSVKLGEIFSVLRERYSLPQGLDIPREQLGSIAGVTQALKGFITASQRGGTALPVSAATNASAIAPGKANGGTHSVAPPSSGETKGDLIGEITAVFAEVTRYPEEILEPQASLEEDLGIDSVKLGEVFSVLRERYSLPQELDIPRERLRTIAGLTQVLEGYVSTRVSPADILAMPHDGVGNGHVSDAPSVPAAIAPATPGETASADLVEVLRSLFAEVTRYPKEILDPEAGLEEDLGIDSVKLGEVFSVLREKYNLPAEMDIPREQLSSISGSWLST